MGLAAGLNQAGHKVHLFDPTTIPRYCHGEAVSQLIEDIHPDLVVNMGQMDFFMDAEAVLDQIRRHRVFHVYWATEDRPFHRRVSVPFARFAQVVLTIDASCVPYYQAMGLQADILPFGCNPAIHCHREPEPILAHDLALIAHNTPAGGTYRPRSLTNLLLPFLSGDYDLAVWGCGWDRPFAKGLTLPTRFYHGILSYEDAAKAASSAQIILGPQWDAVSPTQVSCRTFETLGSGAFLLTADVPGVRRFFQDGVHLATTDSPARTKALVEQYLPAMAERKAIAACGQSLVHAKHTYLERAQQFQTIIERCL